MGNTPACACCGPKPETITKIGGSAPPVANVQVQSQSPLPKKDIQPVETSAAAASSLQKGIEPIEKELSLPKKFMFGRSESKVEELMRGRDCSRPLPQDLAPATKVNATSSSASEPSRKRRASVDGGVQVLMTDAPTMMETPTNASRAGPRSNEPLQLETVRALENLFHKMDLDGSQEIKIEEAAQFWRQSFANVSAQAMFNEVDADQDGSVILDEFMSFWQGVKQSGYTDEEIVNEIELLLEGNSWVDWKDARSTTRPG